MKTRIQEEVKIDVGLVSQALNNTNATGRYFGMSGFRSLCAILIGAAMAATKTTKLELLQATDPAGSDSKAITGAEKTVTANADVIGASIALAAAAATDKAEVNGIEFTMAVATDVAAKEFADAAGLAACINYWCPGVVASDSGTTVTVVSLDGKADVTTGKTEVSGTITLATTEHLVFVEIKAGDLDRNNAFTHVAVKATTSANTVLGVTVLRGRDRMTPEQIGVGLAL